ncbi:fibronectin type III domain-containing protein [Kineococcus rubinsiae]|uniref:fibronectin type III domain-containing protein n=1 Tax=Kineococcus rubinsiae TaxID=2609562 RepID=UPI0014310ED9|nr:fibronectin type III domain-containing protein [Kineococcus rubinsiae]NIZ90481.1 hypothetical protein [Kineococcus rubinsiae]
MTLVRPEEFSVVRKRRRWAMVVACLPALLVAPPAVAATGSTGELVSGTVVQVATESGTDHDDVDTFLRTDGFDLQPVDDARVTDLAPGSEVVLRVRDADAEELKVLSVQSVAEGAAAATPAATHTVRVAMAVPAGVAQDATPFTTAQVQNAVQQASAYWGAQTGGAVTFSLATTVPWYQSAVACSDYGGLWNEAADKTGSGYQGNEHLVVVVPARAYSTGACDAYGKGTIGNTVNDFGALYVTDMESSLWAHELGHNISLGHANALYNATRSDAATSGADYPGSTKIGYGNIWDVMSYSGNTVGHGNLNIANADKLGVVAGGIQNLTASGTYTLKALPNAADGQLHGLRVTDPATNIRYYVELRGDNAGDKIVASDWRQPAKGVVITKGDMTEKNASIVLDGTPSGNYNSDFNFAVPVGKTVDSASGKLHFKVISADTASAIVQFTLGDADADAVTVTAPDAPAGVTAGATGTTATVSWIAASANNGTITAQTVTPYVDGVAQPALARAVNGTATTTTISGLTLGTSCTFTVKAQNEKGVGAESAASAAVLIADRPSMPTGVTAYAAATTATIDWNAPATNGAPLINYTVTPYRDGVPQSPIDVPGATTLMYSITPDTDYAFTVSATNRKGTSDTSPRSSTVRYTTPVVTPEPPAPTPTPEPAPVPAPVPTPMVDVPGAIAVTATGVADRSAWATFTAAAPAPGSRTLGYVVTAYRSGVAGKPVQVPLTQNRAVVTGLVNGASYTLGLRARTSTGFGPETMTSSLVPITTPALVSGLTARLVSEDRGKLTWTVPANGGSDLTGYTITPTRNGLAGTPISISPTDLEVLRAGAAGPITVAADVDVEPGTTWTYTVVATNGAGVGKASARATLKVPALKAPSAVGTVKAALSYQNLTLTWAAPAPGSRPIEGYTVSVRKNGGAPQETKVTTTTTTLEVDAASTYAVTVTARSELGAAPASRPVTVKVPAMTAPRVVTGLRGVLSGSTYTLTWGQPVDGNSPLQGYTVTQYADGVPVSTRQIDDPTTRTASYTLTANVGYSFTVAASNGVGTTTSSRTTAVKVRG